MPDLVSGQNYIHKRKIIMFKKIIYIFAITLLMTFEGYSQNPANSSTWLEDTNGKIITSNNYTDVDGSPYFPTQWVGGTVTLKMGKVIPFVALRFNTISGNLEFQLNQKPYDVINPIREFTLGDMIFKNGFSVIGDNNADTFYQVIYDGKNKLLCKRESSIYIDQPYNSATKTKTIKLTETYYLSKNDGKIFQVKKNLKNLSMAFEDKTGQIEEYCKKENIKLRSWNDAVKILEYADRLEKQ